MKQQRRLDLEFGDAKGVADCRIGYDFRGLSVESVVVNGPRELSFKWVGERHYLALHDMKLSDGSTQMADTKSVRMLDLRDRMTFLPAQCGISGWSNFLSRPQTFTSIYFDPKTLSEELDGHHSGTGRSLIYFYSAALLRTMTTIQKALLEVPPDRAYIETLCLVAIIEADRLQRGSPTKDVQSGKLAGEAERLVRNFIDDNLHRTILLSEIADLIRMSRFHFAREFKRTVGLAPHKYIVRCRVDRAMTLLLSTKLSLEEIAMRVGISSKSQFSDLFRREVGCSPSNFRRQNS